MSLVLADESCVPAGRAGRGRCGTAGPQSLREAVEAHHHRPRPARRDQPTLHTKSRDTRLRGPLWPENTQNRATRARATAVNLFWCAKLDQPGALPEAAFGAVQTL